MDWKKQFPSWPSPGALGACGGSHEQGFTLLEVLIVSFIFALLAAIATPSWLTMVNNTRLSKAQDAIATAIATAQRQARQGKSSRQVTIQHDPNTGIVQWAVYKTGTNPTAWQNIEPDRLVIDPGSWTITFDDRGQTEDIGKLLISLQSGGQQRCVIVQTLLGTVRKTEGDGCIQP